MDNKNESPEVETKKKNRVQIISWIIGVLIGFTGIGQIFSEPALGILFILLAVIIIPITREKITQKLNNRLSKNIIIGIAIITLVIVGVVLSDDLEANKQVAKINKPKPVETETVHDFVKIGDIGYLRLPGTKDPEQMICLGPTKEAYDQVMSSISAKDLLGIVEAGGFCVGNGTKVKVIGGSFSLKQVRIIEGVREIDKNVVLRSGWVATEWVVKN
ncbi:MAG: hypothetical protein WCW56_02780 [Candidatus Paceibacterota bacterium]|jgi:hypothetical protein